MSLDRIQSNSMRSWEYSDAQVRSEAYLKKNAKITPEHSPAFYASSVQSLTPSLETSKVGQVDSSKTMGLSNQKKGFWSNTWEWVKNKWNSFLEIIGIRKPAVQSTERDRSMRTKILERNSSIDIEEDFKYLDIATTDPLKVMLALLVKQGELREEQAFLIQQKILLVQEDLKDIQDQRNVVQAELALVHKRAGIIEKVNVGVTVGQVIAGVASTASVVASAATIATGGAATPLLIITGVVEGVVTGAQALNAWLRTDTKEKMDKLQGEMLKRNEEREGMQFLLKVDVKDMKKILHSIAGHADMGSMILSAQYGK